MSKKIVTSEFRVAFQQVWEPRKRQGKKDEYGMTMLFDKKTGISSLKQIIDEAIEEEWGNKIPKDLWLPIQDGSLKEWQGFEGCMYAKCKSQFPIGVADDQAKVIIDQNEFYSGCYARASIIAKAWTFTDPDTTMKKNGVSLWVHNVQKLRDGEPFRGGSSAEDDFEAIASPDEDGTSEVDELCGI